MKTVEEIQKTIKELDSLNSIAIQHRLNTIIRDSDLDSNTKELLIIMIEKLKNKEKIECLERMNELVDHLKQG